MSSQPFTSLYELQKASRPFSRFMPPHIPEPWTLGQRIGIAGLGACAATLAIAAPPVALGVAALFIGNNLAARKRLKRLHAERTGESIAGFAHAFDRHVTDAWVIRAVWDELQGYVQLNKKEFPIRTTDSLVGDLSIDPEEVAEIAERAAKRAGYRMCMTGANPEAGVIETAGDLVRFVNAQQRRENV